MTKKVNEDLSALKDRIVAGTKSMFGDHRAQGQFDVIKQATNLRKEYDHAVGVNGTGKGSYNFYDIINYFEQTGWTPSLAAITAIAKLSQQVNYPNGQQKQKPQSNSETADQDRTNENLEFELAAQYFLREALGDDENELKRKQNRYNQRLKKHRAHLALAKKKKELDDVVQQRWDARKEKRNKEIEKPEEPSILQKLMNDFANNKNILSSSALYSLFKIIAKDSLMSHNNENNARATTADTDKDAANRPLSFVKSAAGSFVDSNHFATELRRVGIRADVITKLEDLERQSGGNSEKLVMMIQKSEFPPAILTKITAALLTSLSVGKK